MQDKIHAQLSWAYKKFNNQGAWAQGYNFFMLNSTEPEINHAHKC